MFRNFWNKTIAELNQKYGERKIFLGIGVFDGVHLGHKRVLEELRKISAPSNGVNVAVTFSPHPRSLLAEAKKPQLLIGLETREKFLKLAGADEVITVNFTREFAALSAEEFLNILVAESHDTLGGICVGKNWRFGAGGKGDYHLLAEFCQAKNLLFSGVDNLIIDNEVASSSNIRIALSSGLFEKANRLLGRNYRLRGMVEKGYNIASTKLEKPTANLKIENGILFPDGVYAAWAYLGDEVYQAAVNIGFAPTFNYQKNERRIEVHLLSFDGNIYGEYLEIEIVKHIRSEKSFNSADELRRQIAADITQIKNVLNK
ncbi:MAG: riboflavin biosynthesis protein RibF [Lentisphaeria bacterium]|nr:riboflavin biosynthesis protein RibF [Lentisphaeria bacterium]